jgi:dTDP-4-amino-4,6-dideoxygalactose transaminase
MYQFLKDEIQKEIDVLLSMDNDSELFHYQHKEEIKIGKWLGGGYATGTDSGTSALHFSLISLGIGPGDEVLTVPNTYIATLLAISSTGARPIFVDVNKDTLLMDSNLIERAISENTKAILPVHLYGQMCDMDAISRIAKKYRIKVVEDACQAHLARNKGKLPGEKSDAACYSFFANKNLGGISNGGMIISKSRKLQTISRKLRNPSSDDPILLKSLRTPAYLDWIQIAFIKCRLKYIKKWTEVRRKIASYYHQRLENTPIELPYQENTNFHVFRDFVIKTKKRDSLMVYLKRRRIETVVHYPIPLHLTKTYRKLGYNRGDFPISESAANEILSIPINPFLKREEVDYVVKSIRSFCNRNS